CKLAVFIPENRRSAQPCTPDRRETSEPLMVFLTATQTFPPLHWDAEACTEPAEMKRLFCPTGTLRTVSPARQGFRGQFAEGLLVGGGEMTGLGKAQAVRQIHQLQVTRAGAAQTVACQLQTALLQIAQRTGLQIVAEGLLQTAATHAAGLHQLLHRPGLFQMLVDVFQ